MKQKTNKQTWIEMMDNAPLKALQDFNSILLTDQDYTFPDEILDKLTNLISDLESKPGKKKNKHTNMNWNKANMN